MIKEDNKNNKLLKIGNYGNLYINAITPWMSGLTALSGDVENWIPLADCIGVMSYPDRESTSYGGTMKMKYFIRTSFMIGRGINGVDNELEVIKDVYDLVKEHLSLN